MNLLTNYLTIIKSEFKGYNTKKFGKDILSGITVAAVALPLALAFGVSSGADAAAGLITAILAGIIIGFLSGGSFQISGPTGAMTAILVSLVASYGLQGVFIACFISGILLLICGIFKLGGLVSFIPVPVITGFTSGIAIIIALGQIDNISGLSATGLTTISKVISYFTTTQSFNIPALLIGLSVIIFMFLYPKKLNQYCPASLMAIIFATIVNVIFSLPVDIVGEIPRTIFLSNRLDLTMISFDRASQLIVPAISIAALGLIESLLCGASASRMKNENFDANQELIAQGIGNMIIPFFGGVPATAAIARTSVAIKAGGQTRLTSLVHSVVLLLSMFLLGSVMSKIPLSALAGVLIVTAWKMNEWSVIKEIFSKKLKMSIMQFLITMISTVIFDLTVAILVGVLFSIMMFVVKVSDMQVNISDIDRNKFTDKSKYISKYDKTAVIYMTGPLYFGTAKKLKEKLPSQITKDILIISMRGVTHADISGIQALSELIEKLHKNNTKIYFSCVQPSVLETFKAYGLVHKVGQDLFFWSTDKALEHIRNSELVTD